MMTFTRPYKVVLIDDDEDMLNLVSSYISSVSTDDIVLHSFSDPVAAMRFVRQNCVHIVITDIHLNDGEEGVDVITSCLNLQKGIQIIALSADNSMVVAIDCFNRGARYFLTKPVLKNELIKVISTCISFLNDWHEILSNKINSHKKIKESDSDILAS